MPPAAPVALLPTTNADGLQVVPLTDDQRFTFDVKGWLLFPGLLSESEIRPIRDHANRFRTDPASLPAEERHFLGGPAQVLLDHPVIVGILNEFLACQTVASEEFYGFRFDHSGLHHRVAGSDNFNPHGGGGLYNFAGNSHHYQQQPGRIFAGLMRVVWELNPVPTGGATLLLSGSHKAAFPRPAAYNDRNSPLWETYTCPPGSLLVFTESLTHTGTLWESKEVDRLATFTCYNTIGSRWAKGNLPHEVVMAMPPKRRSLFRGTWVGFGDGKDLSNKNPYTEENRGL